MSYDNTLLKRARTALGSTRRVEEKRMFGGVTFMVQRKVCISVGKERIMCRIDPAIRRLRTATQGLPDRRDEGPTVSRICVRRCRGCEN